MTKVVTSNTFSEELKNAISMTGSLKSSAAIGFGGWSGAKYLILCEGREPKLVAKIQEVLIDPVDDTSVIVRVESMKSLDFMSEEYEVAYKGYESLRREDVWPFSYNFGSEDFFEIGSPVRIRTQKEIDGFFSMDKAIDELAKSYGVDAAQIEVIIKSKPRKSSND